ncbi:MAG TPA: hypothetical protein VMX97_08550 [Hyphomicrobiaceae bacterium]|nr:hypothetical protein [Hyphomicrobiaceae bacterium]
MMNQRNMLIAGAIAVAVVLAYYFFFANTTAAPKKEGTSRNHYHAIPAPTKYASITKTIS